MVPCYAIDASLSLYFAKNRFLLPLFFTIWRELYEGFALVAFVHLLVYYLGGFNRVVADFTRTMQQPQRCVIEMPYSPGIGFVSGSLTGVLFLSLYLVGSSFLEMGCWFITVYLVDDVEDVWTQDVAFPDVKFFFKLLGGIKAALCIVAMYNLGLLYRELKANEMLGERFKELKPFDKFLCIKIIIFFTAIQKFACETLIPKFHGFDSWAEESEEGWSSEEIGSGVQSFLLCVELLAISVAHFWAYPLSQFTQPVTQRPYSDGNGQEVRRDQCFWCGGVGPVAMWYQILELREKAKVQRDSIKSLIGGDASMEQIESVFETLDLDGDGEVTKAEVVFLFTSIGFTQESAEEWFDGLDVDNNALLSREEFVNGVHTRLHEQIQADPAAHAQKLVAPLLNRRQPRGGRVVPYLDGL
jgi:hypothetical protein